MISENKLIFDQIQSIFPFDQIDDSTLRDLTPKFKIAVLSDKCCLFSIGDSAEDLYFILSGNIKVIAPKKEVVVNNLILTNGDHIGEEAILNNVARKTTAICQGQVKLLKIDRETIQALCNKSILIKRAFQLFCRSYLLSTKLQFPWITPRESIFLISRKHILFMFLRLVSLSVLGLLSFSLFTYLSFSSTSAKGVFFFLAFLSLGVGILSGVWAAFEWSNDYFIVTRERVLVQKRLVGFFDSRQESPMSAILSTGFDTSLLGRLFGFGTVRLHSYTGDIHFHKLPNPDLIFNLLENQRERVNIESKSEEKKIMREMLTHRLNNPADAETIPMRSAARRSKRFGTYQSGSFSDLLARFFQLRQEKNNSVIYRTHWWILIKKTLIPFLFLLLAVIGVLFRAAGLMKEIPESFFYTVTLIAVIGLWGWWFYQYLDWQNDVYIVTQDQLIDVSRKPLGFENRRAAPVKNIQTVEFLRKGLIGLILNFGTVRIKIGNEELTFDDVYNPSEIQTEIYSQLKEYNERQQMSEQQRWAEWIKTYDDLKGGQVPPEGNPPNLKSK
jgi:hypothetical protein